MQKSWLKKFWHKLVIIQPQVTILAFLLIFLGQVLVYRFSPTGGGVYAFEPLVFLSVILLLPKYRLNLYFTASYLLLILWLIVTFCAHLGGYTQAEFIWAGLYLARLLFYITAFYFVLSAKSNNEVLLKSQLKYPGWLYGGILLLLTGVLFQLFFFPTLYPLISSGWDPHTYRATGTFLEPVYLAVICSILAIFLLIHSSKDTWFKPALIALHVMLLLSFSRAALVVYILVIVFWYGRDNISQYKQQLAVGVFALVVLFGGLWLTRLESLNILRVASINARIEDYGIALNIFKKEPVTGIGYNFISTQKKSFSNPLAVANHAASSFHNSFLILLVTTGVVGAGLFLWFFKQILQLKPEFVPIFTFIAGVSLFDNVLLHPYILTLVLCLILLSPGGEKET